MLKTTSNYYKDEWSVQCVFFFLSFLIVNAQRKKYTLAFMGKKKIHCNACLGAQVRTSTKNQSKFHVTYQIICFFGSRISNLTLLETCVDAQGAQERAWARRNVQARKINQNSMLHIQSYVFGIKDFEFDTFRNLRQRTRRVGTRLGAQELTSTTNHSKLHVTYLIMFLG